MFNFSKIFDRPDREQLQRAAQAAPTITYILAGLGNPGREYENTRHNAGFMAIDYISGRLGVKIDRHKFNALCGDAVICTEGANQIRVLLMKPQTFMNFSGKAVSEAANFYKIPPEHIIVIHDDVSFDIGTLRVRRKGSAGGQKGLESIIQCLGSDAVPRIKIGVGKKPHPDYDLSSWVLGHLGAEDKKTLCDSFPSVFGGFMKIIDGDIDAAMQMCN